jgi:epoxyqueuosine reductase
MSSIIEALNENEIKYRFTGIEPLAEIKKDYENKISSGILSKELSQYYLENMAFDYRNILGDAKSILIVAVPHIQVKVGFTYHEKEYSYISMPAFSPVKGSGENLFVFLFRLFKENNRKLAPIYIPQKYMAVRSGLTQYGRNNISYTDEYGSYFGIITFLTDMESARDEWQEFKVMDECEGCKKCIRACPTGALNDEKFMINAPKCLTFLNENAVEIPADIKKSAHNCLIGCMNCQKVCPKNENVRIQKINPVNFSENETEFILRRTREEFPESIINKLKILNLLEYADVISRNLRLLILR